MKKFSRWIVVSSVALSLVISTGRAMAQVQAKPPAVRSAAPNIALLDISYIFKNHARFKGNMEDLKKQVAAAEEKVKTERTQIDQLTERLQEYRRGTPDYTALEAKITQQRADLAAMAELKKREFVRNEAKIYHNVYQEITDATNYYIQEHGIDMVLRFNGDPVDAEQPESVLSWINKPVVAYQGGVDITPAILKEMNRTQRAVSATARPPAMPFRSQ